MGLLSREGMRDGNIGICWDAGHIGICGICGEDGGYAEICGICGDMWDMRDGPPPRNRPGRAAVFGPPPPPPTKAGRQKRQTINEPKKRMLILYLTC